MKALDRRLRRLEERFGPPVETEYTRKLWRRIEAGRRRVAADRGEPYVPWVPNPEFAGLTLTEVARRIRERDRRREIQDAQCQPE